MGTSVKGVPIEERHAGVTFLKKQDKGRVRLNKRPGKNGSLRNIIG